MRPAQHYTARAMAKKDTDKQLFLDAFAACGVIATAAREAGTTRTTVVNWRKSDPEFDEAYREAEEEAADHLEQEATRRAVEGVTRQKMLGSGDNALLVEETTYSDPLLMFLLKARRPDRFAERSKSEISGPDGKPIQTTDTSTALRLQAILEEAKARKDGKEEDDLFS